MAGDSISRREFLQSAALVGMAFAARPHPASNLSFRVQSSAESRTVLQQFAYGDVTLNSAAHEQQLANCREVLMTLSEDGLLKPFREMAGLSAPGEDLGGWYIYKPDYDYRKDSAGLAPGATFGQWISSLSRMHAIDGDSQTRDKVLHLNQLYAGAISSGYFEKNRFPAYSYDKLTCGLIDAHEFAADPNAFAILDKTTQVALPNLPPHAVDREQNWRPGKDISYSWDESYTLPENLFLAYQRGAGDRFRQLATRYLDDATYFDPLSEGQNVLAGKHAYSYVNALSSAMQAYLTLGSEKHLRAARNGFEMLLRTQSFATGGWGPDEQLRPANSDDLLGTLSSSHSSFETPCGAYAHFKLTRYLLLVTGDPRYGDSMERVMYNTVLGAKPLKHDGEAFYYSDYNFQGHKVYSRHRWPCCSGTLPQVAADYRINTYFRDGRNVYVNLYIPSTVRWKVEGSDVELTQIGNYPWDTRASFEIKTAGAKPTRFAVYLRVPAWAESASLAVNGSSSTAQAVPGSFARVERQWKTGDRVEVAFAAAPRLEPIDSRHPDIVALMIGPLVLFPVTNVALNAKRKELLAVRRTGPGQWQVQTASGSTLLLPFLSIQDEPYCTYIRVS